MNPRSLFPSAAALVSLLLPFSSLAQTIPNPSFEANSFTVFPGYSGGANGQITGWNATTGSGLNPAGGSPFADNGTIPNGTQVAFVQSGSIDTVITGLTAGTQYRLAFRINARGGQTPILDLQVDGATLLLSPVNSINGTNPYRYVAVDFTAASATATLALFNTQVGDTTFVVDDFTIAPSNNSWKTEPWNDDDTSGLDPSFLYTHAYNFGSGAGTTINGVAFVGVAGTNPTVAGKFTSNGLTGIIAADPNNVIGESRILADSFVYTARHHDRNAHARRAGARAAVRTDHLLGQLGRRRHPLGHLSRRVGRASIRSGRLRGQQRHPLHPPLHRARGRHLDDPDPSDPERLDPLVRHRQSRGRGRGRAGHLE